MTSWQIQDGGQQLIWKSLSAYIDEKWCDYDEIWYSKIDIDYDKKDLTKIQILNHG